MFDRLSYATVLANVPRLTPETAPHIYKLESKTVIKVGNRHRISEAAAMRFVRSKTNIPVPEVYDAYLDQEDPEKALLVMEHIEGDVLRDVWDDMCSSQKEEVVLQLKGFLDELRSIKGDFIGSVDGAACEDPLFDQDPEVIYGPYNTEAAFNDGIIRTMKSTVPGSREPSSQEAFVEMVADMVRAMPGHDIVLTHGDIAPRNILVHGSKIVAVLDWELTGFYPEYWEYVKALYLPDWDQNWIRERAVDKCMKPYHIEHAVMRQVNDLFW